MIDVTAPRNKGDERILICYGTGDLAKLISRRSRYDLCYVIEGDREKAAHLRAIFKSDKGVGVLEEQSIDVAKFCRSQRIEVIHTLSISLARDRFKPLSTVQPLIKEGRIEKVECVLSRHQLGKLKKICGDLYDVRVVRQKNGTEEVDLELLLRKQAERKGGNEDEGTHVFNIVYGHLKDEERFAVHRGNVSIAWSGLPLEDCDLYLYVNAYSFTERQKGLNVLLLYEPYVVLPRQYSEAVWSNFDRVITIYDKVIEGNENFFKALLYRSGLNRLIADDDITEERAERDKKYPLDGRAPAICMINGNKSSGMPGELYSKRSDIALWFHQNSDIPFDVFGTPPFPLPNYRGALPADAKMKVMSRYRYALAFENVHHPVYSSGYVDKVLSPLETRTIPIYLGADNIDSYIPKECFIDFRSFSDYKDLDHFLHDMSEKEYSGYIEAIDDFVGRGGLQPYSWNTLYDQLIQLYATWKGERIEQVSGRDSEWKWDIAPEAPEWRATEIPGVHTWPWEKLTESAEEIQAYDTARSEVEQAISQSVDRLRGADPNADMYSLRLLIEKGVATADDYYRYAQYLIVQKEYDQAIPVLLRTVELYPTHTYAFNDLGVIHILKEDAEKAIEFYRKAVVADRNNDNALRNLLSLCQASGLGCASATRTPRAACRAPSVTGSPRSPRPARRSTRRSSCSATSR